MNNSFPRPGQLASTKIKNLCVSEGYANELIMPIGSIILFLARTTYKEAIKANGYEEKNLTAEELKDLDNPFWKCLYRDTIFYVAEANIKFYFQPVNVDSSLVD